MLNKSGVRELAYLVRIDAIEPIVGSDNCECAIVGGWHVMTRKGTFKPNDIGIYFEIDSKVDTTKPEFAFLASKGGKVKTQRYTFGGKGLMISQGLLMHPSDFGWTTAEKENDTCSTMVIEKDGTIHYTDDDSHFLTSTLGVTYSTAEDNTRKANPDDKYKKMAQRHAKLFKKPIVRWIMKHKWGRKVMFFFFGKKKDKPTDFPKEFPFVKITDEERIENLPFLLNDKRKLTATEKLDGTSTTFILSKKKNKYEFYVVSRHVRQLNPDQECYHTSNIYWEMAQKYNVEIHLKQYLIDNPELTYVCLQGESVGNVQGNPLKLSGNDFYGFNFIRSDVGRIPTIEGKALLESWGMKWVPIITTDWVNPNTMEEMKALATGKSLVNPDVLREGIVYRDENDNAFSFKNVSNDFLMSKK